MNNKRLAFVSAVSLLLVSFSTVPAQRLSDQANAIRAAMDERDGSRAENLVRQLKASDPAAFTANNYDYLLARLAERRGGMAEAASLYQGLLSRGSLLSQHSLWRLASIARTTGDLALERQDLVRLLASYPSSTLAARARERLIDNAVDRGDYRAAAAQLRPISSASGAHGRTAMAKLGMCYARLGLAADARAAFGQLI